MSVEKMDASEIPVPKRSTHPFATPFKMTKNPLFPVLLLVIWLFSTCCAVQSRSPDEMLSDENSWLRRYTEKTAAARSAAWELERHLNIPHGFLSPVFPHHSDQDGDIIRHHSKPASRFLQFEAGGDTYFASPWKFALAGESEARPGALLFKGKNSRSIEVVGHSRFSDERLWSILESMATTTRRQLLSHHPSLILPRP